MTGQAPAVGRGSGLRPVVGPRRTSPVTGARRPGRRGSVRVREVAGLALALGLLVGCGAATDEIEGGGARVAVSSPSAPGTEGAGSSGTPGAPGGAPGGGPGGLPGGSPGGTPGASGHGIPAGPPNGVAAVGSGGGTAPGPGAPGAPIGQGPPGYAAGSPLIKPAFILDGSLVSDFDGVRLAFLDLCLQANPGRDAECGTFVDDLLATAPHATGNPDGDCVYRGRADGGVYTEGDCAALLEARPDLRGVAMDPALPVYTVTKEDEERAARRVREGGADPTPGDDGSSGGTASDTSGSPGGTSPGTGTSGGQAGTGSEQGTGSGQTGTGTEQKGTGSGQAGTGGGQSGTGDEQTGTGSGQAGTGTGQSGTGGEGPEDEGDADDSPAEPGTAPGDGAADAPG